MIMKPTTQQIDEQVELERTAISQGLKRLQDQNIKLRIKTMVQLLFMVYLLYTLYFQDWYLG